MRNMLITGGMGFIGSNFIRYVLERYSDLKVTNLDLLTYAGNPNNVADIAAHPHYRFIQGDIRDTKLIQDLFAEGFDTVVHFAAESHVDRSIDDPYSFLRTNVIGTQALLEAAKRNRVRIFAHISTDEVYGSLGSKGSFTERTAAQPNSPYAASKAASDFIVRAYNKTFGLPVFISRCSNNYGPYQHPEKLIPKAITNALQGKLIPIYGDGSNVRDWLHVSDHCAAIDHILAKGTVGEVYNIGGNSERTNLEIIRMVLDELGLPHTMIEFVTDRKGHDKRYAINARKLRKDTGWQPSYKLEQGIRQTVRWYKDNEAWWLPQLAGEQP